MICHLFSCCSRKFQKMRWRKPRKRGKIAVIVKKNAICFAVSQKRTTFALAKTKGAIAQLVEQRTENPCVPGSIPGGTTKYLRNQGFAKLTPEKHPKAVFFGCFSLFSVYENVKRENYKYTNSYPVAIIMKKQSWGQRLLAPNSA